MIFLFLVLIFESCSKNDPGTNTVITPPPAPLPPSFPGSYCDGRPIITARLVPIGSLSTPRGGMLCATAGNKILFVDGDKPGGTWWYEPSIVDIYDIVTHTWSGVTIHGGFRTGAAIASVGNKIFFAGGGDGVGDNQTSRVDIYDATTNNWSTAQLSQARLGLAAATVGNKVFFAGGGYLNAVAQWIDSDLIDIYDNATNTWTTAKLSQGRMDLSAITTDDKIFFAGGRSGLDFSNVIDSYDAVTNTWSSSSMSEPRLFMAGIAVNNKIFWAGGLNSINSGYSKTVEIHDFINGATSIRCFLSRYGFAAVRKDDNIIFFTGDYGNDYYSGTHFEIYNITNDTWATGLLSQRINRSSIISVNNTIYVAGGISGPGQYHNQVWKLEF